MFKDSMNRWVTVGLFEETAGPNKDFVIMSLDEARKAFVSCGDLTGYIFAENYLGGWPHWQAILSSPRLSEEVEKWVDELDVKKRAASLQRIEEKAEEGHYHSNKFLADRGWSTRPAGRPSKDEVEKNINREKRLQAEVSHFLTPVKK